jgi:hypothetical protein
MKIRKASPVPLQHNGLTSCCLTALMLAVLLFSCTASQPEGGPVYRSEHGFTIVLPSQWLAVDQLEIGGKENPLGTDNPRIRNLFTAEGIKALKEKARSGGIELFVNLETSDEAFIESINVQSARGSIAIEQSDAVPACAETEKRLTTLYGKPVKMTACNILKIQRMPAVFMAYQVEKLALAHAQYLIQLKTDRYVVMTRTCRPKNLPKLRPEFDAIVASLRAT